MTENDYIQAMKAAGRPLPKDEEEDPYLLISKSSRGGIGRRNGLKIRRLKGRPGSTPGGSKCPYCNIGILESVKGNEPWDTDHYQCNNCDSTYNK